MPLLFFCLQPCMSSVKVGPIVTGERYQTAPSISTIRVAKRWRNARSWVHEHERLFMLQQNSSSQRMVLISKWFVGSSRSKRSGSFTRAGPEKPGVSCPQTISEQCIFIQFSPSDYPFNPLVVMPGVSCLYPVLDGLELPDGDIIAALGNLQGKVMVFSEEINVFLSTRGYDVIGRSRQVIGDILCQHCDLHIARCELISPEFGLIDRPSTL